MNIIEEQARQIQQLKEQVSSLQEAVKESNKINEKKNTLISQISHEIRTPLNVVISMASIAKDSIDSKDIVRDNLTEIANSSRILLGIVNNILDISDLASGTLKVDSKKFDLKDQLTNIGIYFYEHAKYKDVHFDMHIRGVSEENLIGDERRLQQIMVNLFINSLRFTPKGGKIDLTVVQASTSRNRVHMRFIIKDTGAGMSDVMLRNLFLPYEENEAVNENSYTDTGINMFITKQLIEVLGGSVHVESSLGEGTTITVDIPFQKTEQRVMDIEVIKKHRVLIVADEQTANERGDMLSDMGIPYQTVTDGYRALDMLGIAEEEGKPFSVCMVDMDMKGTYADALTIEIKKIFGKDLIVIATSYDGKSEKYKSFGVDYTIENTLFRSTVFDALMQLEKGSLVNKGNNHNLYKQYDFSGKRILVVEDIALNMEVLVKLLTKVNASVVCAENGREALATYERKPAGYFDCVLMDINMPVMDGYQAARAIRSSSKEDAGSIPVFAMTANAFSEDVAKALESGMNGHIAKPIDVQILYKTLNKIFNGLDNSEIENDLLKKAQILEQQNIELKERAEHDPLTGLYNRYAYEKETYSLMRKKEPVGFVLIDIDYFKEINDIYGHETGDKVIKNVADVIKSNTRDSDFVVRIGGDEFAIILRDFGNCPKTICRKVAQINQSLLHPAKDVPGVTVSVGAAFSDIGYTTELYGNADKALYQTKKNGRNGCTVFDEENWSQQDELDKIYRELDEYMAFSLEARENVSDMISIIGYRLFEYALKYQLTMQLGESKQKELFREAGFCAGKYFVDKFLDASLSLSAFVSQLTDKLKELKIGNLVLDEMNETTGQAVLSVFEDADCSGMKDIGETVCQYDEGFIAGVLSAYTNQRYTATETECWAKGDKVCRFVAVPQDNG